MSKTSFTEKSRKDYFAEDCTFEQIQTGCLQRIADASEQMAKNYIQLQADLAWYKKLSADRWENILTLQRQISSLKGVVTKLKKASKVKNEN
jgi:hypothetical protein